MPELVPIYTYRAGTEDLWPEQYPANVEAQRRLVMLGNLSRPYRLFGLPCTESNVCAKEGNRLRAVRYEQHDQVVNTYEEEDPILYIPTHTLVAMQMYR